MICVDTTTDKLGKTIDEGIKRAVYVLNKVGFRTIMSCEGHLIDEGCPYPWVWIEEEAPKGWKEDQDLKDNWKKKNLLRAGYMIKLLDEFYRKNPPRDLRLMLTLDWAGCYGAFRLQSYGVRIMEIEDDKVRAFHLYRREMDKFIDFLETKIQ